MYHLNVSSKLNFDLVVRLCFSVTITTQEEGRYSPFVIRKACVYKSSVENELKVPTISTDDSSSGCCANWWHLPKTTSVVFHHHQSRCRCPFHSLLFLAKDLPCLFGTEEMAHMIPPPISRFSHRGSREAIFF